MDSMSTFSELNHESPIERGRRDDEDDDDDDREAGGRRHASAYSIDNCEGPQKSIVTHPTLLLFLLETDTRTRFRCGQDGTN
jgi:hypothetical protein